MATDFKELFEDLMRYTSVKDSSEIKTHGDLKDFFREVRDDSAKRGRDFKVSHSLFDGMLDFLGRNRSIIENPKIKVIESHKYPNTFAIAQEKGQVIADKGRRLYKTIVIQWKDERGKVVKSPKFADDERLKAWVMKQISRKR